VQSLLTLARSERGLAHRVPVDLSTLFPSSLNSPLQTQASLHAAPVHGDPALLKRMAGNLMDNATRYNIPDGWIKVATGTEGGHAFLKVSNSGRKISYQAAMLLFEPFRRLDGDRLADDGGAGLGLSIVRAIAMAHGGRATASPLPDGGLEVSITLPAAPKAGS
jgi:signal transduction histidine kinase